jgi:putative polyketide hydroxylase
VAIDLLDRPEELIGLPGTRVPHLWVERQGQRISTLNLLDPEDSWRMRMGMSGGGVVLVRPDGFVAWRTSTLPTNPERMLEQRSSIVTPDRRHRAEAWRW